MAQAPTNDTNIGRLAGAARKSAKRLRDAARDAQRDAAKLEEACERLGIGFKIDETTAREGEGDD